MSNRILVALMLASALSATQFTSAAEPPGAQPAQPLDERITDQRSANERPGKDEDEGLDSTGPARPRGLAPAAPQPKEGPAECRGLPSDARQACMEGSVRSRPDAPLPGPAGVPGPKGAPQSQPPRPGLDNR